MAEVWNKICEVLGTDTYHMLQTFIYAMIRAASTQHAMTPEIQKLMTYLETDVAWQKAYNQCVPSGQYTVEQMILILSQTDRKGCGMVMLDKPFMDKVRQTECVDDIVERVIAVGAKGVARRLKKLGTLYETDSIIDTLITMTDQHIDSERNRQAAEEMQGPANYTDNGREYAYGKRTKQTKRRTPDTFERQHIIQFTDDDRQQAEQEVKRSDSGVQKKGDASDDNMEAILGFRPHGLEW